MPPITMPISGTCYDVVGAALTTGKVHVDIVNSEEVIASGYISIQADGTYTDDLYNIYPSYATGDEIYIRTEKAGQHAEAYVKLASNTTEIEADLYMKAGDSMNSSCQLRAIAWSSVATKTVSFIERTTGRMKFQVHALANSTDHVSLSERGIYFKGGLRVIITTLGTNKNNVTAGTVIGDTTALPLTSVMLDVT